MYCEKCGNPTSDVSNYCRNCGHKLPGRVATDQDRPERAAPPPATVPARETGVDQSVLPKLSQPESGKASLAKNSRKTVGTVAAVILVLVVSLFGRSVASLFTSSDGTVAEKVESALSDGAIKEYVAGEYRFKASFPGFPTIDRESISVEGYDVPMAMYTREIDNGEQSYIAVVWDYEALPIEGSDLSLEGGLNALVQNLEGAQLTATAPAPLGGQDGLEGKITAPIDGTQYESYARLTVRGKQLYGVWTMGAPYADFDAFARSFQFMP